MTDPVASAPRRWPIIPTIIVLCAVATMIALGVWQLQRKAEKEALIALYDRNMAMSSLVTYPKLPPVSDTMLFRKSSVVCLEVVKWDPRGGTDRKGNSGIRMIADCRTGAEGPGMRSNTRDHCDALARLPITDAVESLNVSNAAAISLYAASIA